MTQPAAACARACVALAIASSSAAADFAAIDPFATHNAFVDAKPALVLRLLVGEDLAVAAGSSAPLASIARLYDAQPGRLDDAASTFLEFDGPRASLAYRIAPWRKPDTFALTALEEASGAAALQLVHRGADGRATPLAVSRRIVERRGEAVVAEYAAGPGLSLAAGTLHIDYRVPRSSHARLGELVVDGMGLGRPPASTAFVGKSEQWMSHHGERECPRVRERITRLGPDPASRGMLGALLAAPHPGFESRLVYWKSVRDPDRRFTTHAFVLKVDDTGNMLIDYVRAWLVVPASAKGVLPLVVLSHQGHLYAAMEPLGAQGEVELGVAAELARNGIASLAYDAAPFGTPRASFSTEYLQYYPASGTTAKDLDNLKRLLDRVLDARSRPMAGATFDRARIGIWGFSYGSWISMLAGALDDRIRAVAFSSFHYRDSDIARGLSDSLYIPQLACFAASAPPPISTRRILREYGRNALAVAPDAGLLSEWTAGLADDRVRVVVNPFGHVVSPFERSFVLKFFYRAFAMRARSPVEGPVHVMPSTVAEMAPYIQRENRWRDELVKAMRAP